MPPHWVTGVPCPGHQGRLTGAAGASRISPAGSIPPRRESSAPRAASVACSVRGRPAATHPLSLQVCGDGRHRYFPSVSLVSSSLPREALPAQSPAVSHSPPCWQDAGSAAQKEDTVPQGFPEKGMARGGGSSQPGKNLHLSGHSVGPFNLETHSF